MQRVAYILILLLLASPCWAEVTAVGAAYQDGNGWTQLPANGDTFFVSSSIGSDTYDGTSGTFDGGTTGPKETLAAGLALLSAGDHLLLKRGDTWTDQQLTFVAGTDEDNMTLIGAYGTGARPEIATTAGSNGLNAPSVNTGHWAIVGIYMHPNNRAADDGGTGLRIGLADGEGNILVEDCKFDGYQDNLSIYGTVGSTVIPDGLTVRRNIIINSRRDSDSSERSAGIYADKWTRFLLEENIFDHNGWEIGGTGDALDHNMYIGDNIYTSTLRRNLSLRSSSLGMKFDTDIGAHQVYDNFMCRQPVGGQIGGGPSDSGPAGGDEGIYMEVYNNVWVEAINDSGVSPSGTGVEVNNQKGGYFRNNIIANRAATGSTTVALIFVDQEDGAGYVNYTIDNNIVYNQRGEVRFLNPSTGVFSNVTVSNNVFNGVTQDTSRDLIVANSTALSGCTFSNNTYYHAGTADTYTYNVDSSAMSVATWQSTYEATATVSDNTSSYTAPTRNATSFATSHANGYASFQEWVDDLVAQDPNNGGWDETIMAAAACDYIRAGFDLEEYTPPAPSSDKKVLMLK